MGNHLGNSHDYLCPKCKTGDDLSIEIKQWATLTCDGSDVEGQDHEWDDFSRAICKCGWEGKVVSLIQLPDGNDVLYVCADCDTEWHENQCNPAKDLPQRLTVGDVYTDLECPSCGALCYPI
jgi:DNA-directed RNA polymerase subunit RPC12/RpoP